jgi:hypothetical protein
VSKMTCTVTQMEYWHIDIMLTRLLFARSAYFINRENHPLCDQSLVGFSVVLLDGALFYSLYVEVVGSSLFLMDLFLWLCPGLSSRD